MFAIRICLTFLLIQLVLSAKSGKHTRKQSNLNDEARLMLSLKRALRSFPNEVRPVKNSTDIQQVTFGLALTAIDGMEEISTTESKLTASVWYRYTWGDCRLQWDPEQYGGVESLRIPINMIWRPDIVLFNNVELGMQEDSSALAVVSCGGQVMWIPTGKLTVVALKEPSSWWSEGYWEAEFKFGSWTYDGFRIGLDFYDGQQSMDLTDFKSKSFSVDHNQAVKNVKYYPCCQEPYIDLTFNLTLSQL